MHPHFRENWIYPMRRGRCHAKTPRQALILDPFQRYECDAHRELGKILEHLSAYFSPSFCWHRLIGTEQTEFSLK
jgi:hypothetical protein